MKQPTNPQLSALAMLCVTLIAVVAMLLMSTSVSAQVGQPYTGKNNGVELNLGLTAKTTQAYTWQRDVELQNAATNRKLVYVVGAVATAVACPPCSAGIGGVAVVDFFVTKRKRRVNAKF